MKNSIKLFRFLWIIGLVTLGPAPALAGTGPTTQVCAHVVEKAGHWDCAYPLKPEVAKKRYWSYRFTRQDGRVLKVEVINGAGGRLDGRVPIPNAPLTLGMEEYHPGMGWHGDGALEGREQGAGQIFPAGPRGDRPGEGPCAVRRDLSGKMDRRR